MKSKAKRILNIFLGIIPVGVYILLQFPAAFWGSILMAVLEPDKFSGFLENDLDFLVNILFIQGLIGYMVFGLWYMGVFKNEEKTPLSQLFSVKRAVLCFIMAVCYQVAITFLVALAASFFPQQVEEYSEKMQEFSSSGTPAYYLYSIIVAPIAEEMVFRGVSLNHLKRAMPFWLANILQAVLFGVLHMDIVQGTYAFAMGIVLGLMFKKYNSLYASIFLHICINLTGGITGYISSGVGFLALLVFSFLGVAYSLCILLKKE